MVFLQKGLWEVRGRCIIPRWQRHLLDTPLVEIIGEANVKRDDGWAVMGLIMHIMGTRSRACRGATSSAPGLTPTARQRGETLKT